MLLGTRIQPRFWVRRESGNMTGVWETQGSLKQNGLSVMHRPLWERYWGQKEEPERRMKGNKEDPSIYPRGFSPGRLPSATQLCLEAGGVWRTGLETLGSTPQA